MRKLFRFLKPYRWLILLSMGLLLLRALTEVMLPRLMSIIVDQGIATGDQAVIIRTGLSMLLVALTGASLAVANSYISSRVSAGFSRDLRASIFTQIEHFSLKEFNLFGPATLITRTTNDVTQLQMLLMMMMRIMVMAPMMAIGSMIMALSQDAKLSLVIFGAILLLLVIVAVIIKVGTPYFRIIQEKIDQINLVLRENLTGVRVVRAFNRQDRESTRFDTASSDLRDTSIRINTIMAALNPAIQITMSLATIALVWFGAVRVSYGDLRGRADGIYSVHQHDHVRRGHDLDAFYHDPARRSLRRAHHRGAGHGAGDH